MEAAWVGIKRKDEALKKKIFCIGNNCISVSKQLYIQRLGKPLKKSFLVSGPATIGL